MSSDKPRLLQPTSPDSEPLWVSTPNLRSTFDLVSSCVLTLLICVWTAIHLNIPRYKERWKGSFSPWFWRRIWWMFMGLIAPELVLYTAWSQFSQAKIVTLRLKKIDDEREYARRASKEGIATTTASAQHDDPDDYEYDVELARKGSRSKLLPGGPGQEKLSWYQRLKNTVNPHELERGYYAVMGGFEVVIGKESRDGEWWDIRRTLTPCGTLLLARLGILPPLSITVINDKSKADLLTKSIVCIQACWMLVQALGRKVEGLPITLLELNTIMHVCCALAMYLLWFKKPQDVGTPTVVHDRHRNKPLGALLSINTVTVRRGRAHAIDRASNITPTLRWRDGLFEYKARNSDSWVNIWKVSSDREDTVKISQFWIYENTPADFERSTPYTGLSTGSRRPSSRGEMDPPRPPEDEASYKATLLGFRPGYDMELKRSQAQFMVDYATGKIATFGKAKVEWAAFCEEIQRNGSYGCTKKASNFQLSGQIKSGETADLGWLAVSVGPAIYGGIHLTPWNAHFPTHLERYLWRFSGFTVALGLPTIAMLFGLTVQALDTMNPFKIPFRAFKWVMSFRPSDGGALVVLITYPLLAIIGLGVWALVAGFGVTLIAMVFMYPLTRLYILAEAFASLRNLPKGAYSTVAWTEMFPHF